MTELINAPISWSEDNQGDKYLAATEHLLSDIVEEIYTAAVEEIRPHDKEYTADKKDIAEAERQISNIIESHFRDESYPISSVAEWKTIVGEKEGIALGKGKGDWYPVNLLASVSD